MGCRACPLNEVVAGVMILCKAPWAALKAEKALYIIIIIIILIQPGPEFSLFAYWPAYSTAQYFLVGESRCIACCQYLDKGGEKQFYTKSSFFS